MLAHPFRHLDFVVVKMEMGVHVCVENGWLLKLIGSSAILSVWKDFFSVCFGFDEKSQQIRSFFKQYTRSARNELMSVKANKRLIRWKVSWRYCAVSFHIHCPGLHQYETIMCTRQVGIYFCECFFITIEPPVDDSQMLKHLKHSNNARDLCKTKHLTAEGWTNRQNRMKNKKKTNQ